MRKFLALLTIAAGCGEGNSNSDNGASKSPEFVGIWKSECLVTASSSLQVVMTNDANKSLLDLYYYSDDSCSTLFTLDSNERTYSIGVAVPHLPSTYEIDFTLGKTYRTQKSAEAVDFANSIQNFGFNDWAVNVPKDVSGRQEVGNSHVVGLEGEKLYTIFKVEDEKYYGGDQSELDGTSEANRPTSLSTDTILMRW